MYKTSRKIYIDPTTGKRYALFVNGNVHSITIENDPFPNGEFIIEHGQNSTTIIPRLYTPQNEEVIPHNFKIIDRNTVSITFDLEFSGTIKLLFFSV